MQGLSDNLKGAVLMMCSMAAFVLNDTCIKLLGPEVPLFQMLFLRGVASSILVWALARTIGPIKLRFPARDWGLVIGRTMSEIVAAYFFINALYHMPIANVTAVLQVLPLTVTLGGALFFREPVGWRRFSAILVGFLGMLLIVRPGPDGFDIYALYAMAAVAAVTVRDLTTRRMSVAVPSMTVTLFASLGVTVFSAFASLGSEWVSLDGRQVALLSGASVFILGGYLFSVMVMRCGDVSFTAPFRYSGLVWALVLGAAVFGDWPDALTLAGCVIVVGAGVFTIVRANARTQAKSART
ncbi:DMT family transporter [Shimia sp.]|uniref:DMT family transporter n=1 Tax=Shimia sp. TaxID=1954381 RepID=UPI0032994A5B